MKDIKELIFAAVEENAVKFQEMANELLHARAYEAIESLRPEVSASMFGEEKESKKKGNESCDDMDDEDDSGEMDEGLKGNQHKIDKNKNGKIDAQDFKLLRKEEVEEKDPHDRMMDTAYNAALKAGHKPHSMGFTKDRKKVKMISDTGHGHYDIASKKYVHSKVNEEVELDEMALSADHKAALKTLKSIPSNYSHDDLKKLQAHLSDLHSKASDAERTARHAKQAEVRKANKDRSLKVSHETEGRSANYTNDDGHRLHITRDKNTGGYHAHISNAKGKYVDSGGKTTLMYNHKVGKYAKHFKEETDIQEVAPPKTAADWQALITHQIKTTGHPVATDAQFRATTVGKDTTKIASQEPGEDKMNYAKAQGGEVKQ